MKCVSKLTFAAMAALCLGLGLSSCGQEKAASNSSQLKNFADESVDPRGAYTAVASDLYSGQEFIQTGKTEADAIRNALELCNARTSPSGVGGGCTLKGRPIRNGMGVRVNGGPAEGWACLIQEHYTIEGANRRSWIGLGATPQAARTAAEKKCEMKAGIQCQVVQCFNADSDKFDYPS